MNYYEDPKFNPGAIVDRVDLRDYPFAEIAGSFSPFDWFKGFDVENVLRDALKDPSFKLPTKDQGNAGSCGGQAWSYDNEVAEAIASASFEESSAKFIYAQTWVPGGGSAGRDNSIVVVNQGCARESVLPSYDGGNPPSEAFMERSADITDPVRADAKLRRSGSFFSVGSDIDSVAQAAALNNGMIIGIVGQNNGTWSGLYPAPAGPGNIWRHWLFVGKAKLINGVKHVAVKNSWGNAVGDNGWQWLRQEHFTQALIFGSWVTVFNPQSIAPSFSHNFTTDLSYGMGGVEVVALQKALQLEGSLPASIPVLPGNKYLNATQAAVLRFQERHAVAPLSELLQLNGKRVGPSTRKALNALFNH